jgi:hypothetical protein
MLVMYRPVQQTTQNNSVKSVFLSQRNYDTLQTVLVQDFQRRISAPLNDQQISRLNKSLNHYIDQVYSVNGERQPVQVLNKEVLTACAQDFTKYIQRKDATRNVSSVQTVMDESLFQEVGQRYERLTQERNEVKALPPAVPDFRISLSEDGPAPAELYEMAKKHREMEALRSAHNNSEMMKANMGMQKYVSSDSSFKVLQDSQNRNTELALLERQNRPRDSTNDMPLVVMPDRRELMLAPVGTFDTMTQSPMPRELGNANSNPTIVQPEFASPVKNDLPQNYVVREERTVSYKEVENNLFIYSADRDWLRNNKENRYNFTVSFDPAANGQSFGPNPGVQEKFKNIVRIEFVKAIMPGEGLDVTINHSGNSSTGVWDTSFQDNILSFPYVTVRVAELENNNFGTDNFLDRSFGVLQYDANWITDTTQPNTRGYLAMIPKFLKCEKVYHPTPLSTLQKMTIDIHRPNGELISNSPDTFDISAILNSSWTGGGAAFPYNFPVNTFANYGSNNTSSTGSDINYFFIQTSSFFSRFQVSAGDKIQINGFTYDDTTLAANPGLADFVQWINRNEGHTVISTAYTSSTAGPLGVGSYNDVGYANIIIIQARYNDPTTGSVTLNTFSGMASGISDILYNNRSTLQSPRRLIDINKQLTLVFRVITREMDALPQLRPDNNY